MQSVLHIAMVYTIEWLHSFIMLIWLRFWCIRRAATGGWRGLLLFAYSVLLAALCARLRFSNAKVSDQRA